jgi:hypothetical protein
MFVGSGRRRAKETEDNEQNLEAQRERYYATMQKVPLHDKIPGEYCLC